MDESALRGVPFSVLLKDGGRFLEPEGSIMHSSKSSSIDVAEDTFQHSIPATHLKRFISHSWADSPSLKYLALLWMNNHRDAFAWANIAALLWAAGTSAGLLPTVPLLYVNASGARLQLVFGYSAVVYGVVFLLGVLTAHNLTRYWRDDLYFLDKLCIHQTNPTLKAKGIASLDLFLRRSERLLVFWTPEYFNRLWCNHEIACFLSENDVQRIDFMPLTLPPTILVTTAGFTLVMWAVLQMLTASEDSTSNGMSFIAFILVLAIGVSVPFAAVGIYLTNTLADRLTLRRTLASFGLEKARCTCCDWDHKNPHTGQAMTCDRVFVRGEVTKRFGSISGFDTHVQQEMGAAVRELMGPTLLPMSLVSNGYVAVTWLYTAIDLALNCPEIEVRMANFVEIGLGYFCRRTTGALGVGG